MKISKDVGIVLYRKPGLFDLNIAFDLIDKEGKYAWGTGGIKHIPEDEALPDEPILGLMKTSKRDEIIYGVIVDTSKEFRKYLGTPNSNEKQLDDRHKRYRRYGFKDYEDKAILFLTDIFLFKTPIEAGQIKVLDKKSTQLSRSHRPAVFIDIKRSKINPDKIVNQNGTKEFESFSDNPLVQLLDYNKEDNLTDVLVFMLKNNINLTKEFLKLCGINRKSDSLEIYTRKQLESMKDREKNIPDIRFEWEDGFKIIMEAKLSSPVNKKQLQKYKKNSKREVICIAPSKEKEKLNGESFVSWEDIYGCIKSTPIETPEQKFMVKYFLGYLTNLGLSK